MITVEVSAFSVQWAVKAQECGANRIELCANLKEGGTTPSIGCIQLVREKLKIKLFVIVRPRGGDFYYNQSEIETIARDIDYIKRLGVDGIVIGLLNSQNQVEIAITRQLVDLARPMEVTFHRAFDKVENPFQALEEVIETGCTRILTSGLKATAIEGANLLRELNKQSKGRIIIMPGSAVNEKTIEDLWLSTNLTEYHLSAKKQRLISVKQINSAVNFNLFGSTEEFEYELDDKMLRKVIELTSNFSI